MQAASFERLKARLARDLSAEQCMELVTLLRTQAHERLGEVIVQRRTEMVVERHRCVHCGNRDVVRHGRDENGRQRFRCRKGVNGGCGKTFNALTGSVLARMRHPGKWVGYAAAMADHKSIADVTAQDIDVAPLTAWRWRQKLLSVQAAHQASKLRGVVEADETFFRTSYKGSRGW
jgi:transposase-like protein